MATITVATHFGASIYGATFTNKERVVVSVIPLFSFTKVKNQIYQRLHKIEAQELRRADM